MRSNSKPHLTKRVYKQKRLSSFYKYFIYYSMKTPLFLLLFLCLTLTFSLKPKPEAQAHLRGKISQMPNHQMEKVQQHNLNQPPNQHKQKLIDHDRSYETNGRPNIPQNQQNHQLFGHHSSSTSYRDNQKLNHQQDRHDWDSSSTTHQQNLQGINSKQHNKVQQNHKLFDDETTSPTSSSDYRHEAQTNYKEWTQKREDDTIEQQTADNGNDKNKHDNEEHEFGSTTSSYTDGRYQKMEGDTHDDQMIRTRHHQAELHDEYSQGNRNLNQAMNMDSHDDMNDDGEDHDDYSTRDRQMRYRGHKQNDRDEPHNGNRYYYVDENNIPTDQVDSSSQTSSVKQPNLRQFVDYNNPLDPEHPLVQQQTNVITTEVPDTIGAGKGARFDEDTSVSSSVISEYQKKKTEAREMDMGGEHGEATYVPPTVQTTYIPPPLQTTYISPPVQTTYIPPPLTEVSTQPPMMDLSSPMTITPIDTTTSSANQQDDTSSSSRQLYHQTSVSNHHPDMSQSHKQKSYKYEADAHQSGHNMEPYDKHEYDTHNIDEQIYHKAELQQENHLEHNTQPQQEQTMVKQSHLSDAQNYDKNHLQYGTGDQHDNDDDDMNDFKANSLSGQQSQNNSNSNDRDNDIHEQYNTDTQKTL